MTKAKHNILIDKSIEAALSAIELYNKPNFNYREESFAILMINAWELLLKAKILKDNNGKMRALYVPQKANKKDGTKSKKITYKRNRAKNFMTLSIIELINKTIEDNNLKKCLEILIEIRDNSIHFTNSTKLFEKYMLETAIASLKNYSILISEWFDRSLEEYNLFLIPIAFNLPSTFSIDNLNKETDSHKKLLEFISNQRSSIDQDSKYNVTIVVDVKLERNKTGDFSVKFDKDGIPISVDTEELFKKKYPWDYNTLVLKAKGRYSNFKTNSQFHEIRKRLCEEKDLKGVRYLDHSQNKGIKKDFYSTNILNELDSYYEKTIKS